MTRKVILLKISSGVIWKETAKYLKHYRMRSDSMEEYNMRAGKLIELFRRRESDIKNKGERITKFQFREEIKELEKEF